MITMPTHGLILPSIGIVLILSALILAWRRPIEKNSLTAMFLGGTVLLLLSDSGIRQLKISASGLEVTREELKQATIDYTKQIAKLGADVEGLRRISTVQNKLLEEHQSRLDRIAQGPTDEPSLSPKPSPELNKIEEIVSQFARNSKFSILVFYRTGAAQKAAAEAVAGEFLRRGYQSSATNTDLKEIAPQLADDKHSGNILIVAKSSKLPFLNDVETVVKKIAEANKLDSPTIDDEEWTFRRGDVQIYIF